MGFLDHGFRNPLQNQVDREWRRTWFPTEKNREREVTPAWQKQLIPFVINSTETLKECRAEPNSRRRCFLPRAPHPQPSRSQVCTPNPSWNLGGADLIPVLMLRLLFCKHTTQNPQWGKKWDPGQMGPWKPARGRPRQRALGSPPLAFLGEQPCWLRSSYLVCEINWKFLTVRSTWPCYRANVGRVNQVTSVLEGSTSLYYRSLGSEKRLTCP